VLYAREAKGGGEESSGGDEQEPADGPAVERPSGLWTPPGT
jgi:hypothetical protein